MIAKRVISSADLMRPIAHFSHAVRVGNTVYVGATAGTDAMRRLAGASPGLVDAAAQMRRMLENLVAVLGLLGARLEHLVHLKSYLTDVRDLATYEELAAQLFQAHEPAHAIVGSSGFPLPQAAVELDAVAIVDEPIERNPGAGVRAGARHYCTARPVDSRGHAVGGGIAAQTLAALDDIEATLGRAGLTLQSVVNLHVTLADIRDFPQFEVAFQQRFRAPYPSRTVVAAPLSRTDFALQIESVAHAARGRMIGTPNPGLGCASAAMLAGDELFISGHLGTGVEEHSGDGMESQTRSAWGQIAGLLTEAGMGLSHVVRTNNVLADWRHYREFNAGYGAHVSVPYPPRTTVIAGLLKPGALVQTEAIAHANAGEAVVLDTPEPIAN